MQSSVQKNQLFCTEQYNLLYKEILLLNYIFYFNGLKRHLSHTSFINNAHSFFIYHSKAGISPGLIFIKKYLILGQPCKTTIQTCFNCDVMATFYCIWVREQQNILIQYIIAAAGQEAFRLYRALFCSRVSLLRG